MGGVEPPMRKGINCRHGGGEGEARQGEKIKWLKEEFQELSRDANIDFIGVVSVTHRLKKKKKWLQAFTPSGVTYIPTPAESHGIQVLL